MLTIHKLNLLVVVVGLILIGSCKPAKTGSSRNINSKANDAGASENPEEITPAKITEKSLKVVIEEEIQIPEDSFVFEFLDNNCSGCHGYDDSG